MKNIIFMLLSVATFFVSVQETQAQYSISQKDSMSFEMRLRTLETSMQRSDANIAHMQLNLDKAHKMHTKGLITMIGGALLSGVGIAIMSTRTSYAGYYAGVGVIGIASATFLTGNILMIASHAKIGRAGKNLGTITFH